MNCRVGWCYGNFIKRLCTIGWAFTGLIAAALITRGSLAKRELAFGVMIKQLLPPGLVGLMIAAILATVIASCAAYMIAGSALFTRNLYQRYLRPSEPDAHYLRVGRVASAVLTLGGLLMALYMRSVVDATVHFVTAVAFVGVPMWVGIIWPRANAWGAWASIFGSTTSYAVIRGMYHVRDGRELFYPLLIGLLGVLVVSRLTRPESPERLRRFFALLHTPVGEEANLERAGMSVTLEASR